MLIPIIAMVIRLLYVLVEFPYLRRNRIQTKQNWDKHSEKLWDAANAIELVGFFWVLPALAACKLRRTQSV